MPIDANDLERLLQTLSTPRRKTEEEEGNEDAEYDDLDVTRKGKKIILPKGMTYDEAIIWMKKKRKQEEQEVDIQIKINAFFTSNTFQDTETSNASNHFISINIGYRMYLQTEIFDYFHINSTQTEHDQWTKCRILIHTQNNFFSSYCVKLVG